MGKKIDAYVTIDAAGVHVLPPTIDVPFKAANAEIVWTIETKGWWFTERGIDIKQDDGLARLLLRRDRHLLGLVTAKGAKAAGSILAAMERDYERFILTGGRQFHSPMNKGSKFRWLDYNDYRELYKYSIEVTNGSTTMWHDPGIKNQGC